VIKWLSTCMRHSLMPLMTATPLHGKCLSGCRLLQAWGLLWLLLAKSRLWFRLRIQSQKNWKCRWAPLRHGGYVGVPVLSLCLHSHSASNAFCRRKVSLPVILLLFIMKKISFGIICNSYIGFSCFNGFVFKIRRKVIKK
jgi:hypothetical protein